MSAGTATTGSSSEGKPLRVMVWFGSPHRGGNTGRLVDALLTQLPPDVQVDFYDTYKARPEPCLDCGYCVRHDGCSLHDLDAFMKTFEEADAIIVASPVYYGFFPAPLKALLDRFQRYFSARFSRNMRPPVKKPKRAVLLATCGSGEQDGFSFMEKELRRSFTVLNTTLVGSMFVGNTDARPVRELDHPVIMQLAKKLYGE